MGYSPISLINYFKPNTNSNNSTSGSGFELKDALIVNCISHDDNWTIAEFDHTIREMYDFWHSTGSVWINVSGFIYRIKTCLIALNPAVTVKDCILDENEGKYLKAMIASSIPEKTASGDTLFIEQLTIYDNGEIEFNRYNYILTNEIGAYENPNTTS